MKERYQQEVQVLTEMIAWLEGRIREMGKAPVYEEMKENLEWELKTAKSRLENENNL